MKNTTMEFRDKYGEFDNSDELFRSFETCTWADFVRDIEACGMREFVESTSEDEPKTRKG